MEIIVVNEKNEVLRGGDPETSSSSIFYDLPRKSPEEAVAPAGEPGALIHWRYFPFFRWHLIAYRSGGDVRAPVKMARRVVVSAMICTILVLLGTLLLVFYHYIQRPLDQVVKAAGEVSGGVLEPLPVLRNDEIGRLTITFNSMIKSLKENREHIDRNMEALQKSLHEKEILLQEVHHRVRNNLNVIVSLLNLRSDSISGTEDAVQAFIESRDRIRSMAMIHQQLYESRDFGNVRMDSYIRELMEDLSISSAIGDEIRFEALLDPISLDLVRAVPLGLIINEALSNAFRHAYPDGRGGAIRILFKHDLSDRMYILRVEDDGTGIPEGTELFSGLGLTLIRELSAQIDGTLNIDGKRGTRITVQFPPAS
jgi:two-component sensor histidine kinase